MRGLRITCALFALAGGIAVPGWAAGRQQLHGHVPAETSTLPRLGLLESSKRLNLVITLPLRHSRELQDFLEQVRDPHSPLYHHYLTPGQFAENYGPSEADYQAVMAFAQSNNLAVLTTSPNRVVLEVSGTAGDVQKALNVRLARYQRADGTEVYAPENEPSLDLDVPLVHISGLDNLQRPRPTAHIKDYHTFLNASSSSISPAAPPRRNTPTPTPTPATGSAPSGLFWGTDFRNAYVPNVCLTGTGQSVALVEFEGYYASDIQGYESLAGLPNVTLTNVPVDGFSLSVTDSNGIVEVSLDIEMVISMAPGLSQVLVYEEPNNADSADILLNQMATDDKASQISCSWTGFGDAGTTVIFQQFEAQGQSFFQAAGDYGAYVTGDPTPAVPPPINLYSQIEMTVVGGTELKMSGGSYLSETTWNGPFSGGNFAGGGGVCSGVTIPSYQQTLDMTANGGSTVLRNIPDVSMNADNDFVTADQSYVSNTNYSYYTVVGTSAAAPLWGGFLALANQQAQAAGVSAIGFANLKLYPIGQGTGYAASFHDITTGNNNLAGNPMLYPAVPGYDLATGWGSPTGQALLNALTGVVFAPCTSTPTPTGTFTNTLTPTPTATRTPTASTSPTNTGTSTATPSATASSTPTPTSTSSWTPTASLSGTPTVTKTRTFTPTDSMTTTPSLTASATPSPTATPTVAATSTVTSTLTPTASPTNSPLSTSTATATSSPTGTSTRTDTPTLTPTNTLTAQPSSTPTGTATSTGTSTFTSNPTSTATLSFTSSPTPTSSSTSTATPPGTPTASSTSSPTFTSTATSTASATPTATPTSTATASLTDSDTPTLTPTDTLSPTGTSTPTGTATSTATPSSSPSLTATASPTDTATSTATATLTPTNSATNTGTPTFTPTPTATATSSFTATSTSTGTDTRTSTFTSTPTDSMTPTASLTASATPSLTATSTASLTPTSTNTPTSSFTTTLTSTSTSSATPAATATDTGTATSTATKTGTPTDSTTPTLTPTNTATSTSTSSPTLTASAIASSTQTPTFTSSWTPTGTASSTASPTFTSTATSTASATPTATPTYTVVNTLTLTPKNTATSTLTDTATLTPTSTATPTGTPTATNTPTLTATHTSTDTATPTETSTATNGFTSSPTATPSLTPSPLPGGTQPGWLVYPNPSRGGQPIHWRVVLTTASEITLKLYDLDGELVYQATIQGNAGVNLLTWNLQNQEGQPVAEGLYLFELEIAEGFPGAPPHGKVVVLR